MDKKLLLIQKILSKMNGGNADLWKIYKLMYFIDFENYRINGISVTDSKYYNWQYGPMPYKNSNEYAFLNMIDEGEKRKLWKKVGDNMVEINSDSADTHDQSNFTKVEEIVIEKILNKYAAFNGAELVAISHEDMPWKMTKRGEEIDYDYVMWRDSENSIISDIDKEVFA